TANPHSLPHPEIPYINFEACRAKAILKAFLTVPALNKDEAAKLARRAKYWRRSGRGEVWQQRLSEMYRHLPRRMSGKCQTRSELVTALATYFWQCKNIRTSLNVPARYEFIGRIIEGISTPSCLLCGRRHCFQSWRAVRAVDDEKGKRHPSR